MKLLLIFGAVSLATILFLAGLLTERWRADLERQRRVTRLEQQLRHRHYNAILHEKRTERRRP